MIIDSQTIGSLVGDTYGRRAMADGRQFITRPSTVTRNRDCDLNTGPSAPESSTLTTRPEMNMGWVHPWVGLGWVAFFNTCDGLGEFG